MVACYKCEINYHMTPSLLMDHHTVFSLQQNGYSETDFIQLEINTGDAQLKTQYPSRLPYVAKQEVARQLQTMQEAGRIQPSHSP